MKLVVEIVNAVITDTHRSLRDHLVQLIWPAATKAAALPDRYLIQVRFGLFRSDISIHPASRKSGIGDLRELLGVFD